MLFAMVVETWDMGHLLMELYNRQRASSMVWYAASEGFWRYQIKEENDPSVAGKQMCVRMIVDDAGAVQGYVIVATKRWSKILHVYALNIAAGVSWQEVVPPLLRALQAYGLQIPVMEPHAPPLNEISFWLGSAHPVYEVLGEALAPFYEPPYAWYIRVPDVLAFLRHIAPALERRIANSEAAASFTGELTLDFFRGGLHVVFDKGRITQIEPWRAPICKSRVEWEAMPGRRAILQQHPVRRLNEPSDYNWRRMQDHHICSAS